MSLSVFSNVSFHSVEHICNLNAACNRLPGVFVADYVNCGLGKTATAELVDGMSSGTS
jgi:hypothetical protein